MFRNTVLLRDIGERRTVGGNVGAIFLIDGDGGLTEMNESTYEAEALLQQLLERYPKLIPGPMTVAKSSCSSVSVTKMLSSYCCSAKIRGVNDHRACTTRGKSEMRRKMKINAAICDMGNHLPILNIFPPQSSKEANSDQTSSWQ